MKLLKSAMLALLIVSTVAAKEFEVSLGGERLKLVSARDWSLSPDKKTSGSILRLAKPRVKIFVDPFPNSSEAVAKQYIHIERENAKLGNKAPIEQIKWGNGSRAFLWPAPNSVLLFFPVRGKWYRCFIQHASLDRVAVDSIIHDLETLR